jgi:hypothetical protein
VQPEKMGRSPEGAAAHTLFQARRTSLPSFASLTSGSSEADIVTERERVCGGGEREREREREGRKRERGVN